MNLPTNINFLTDMIGQNLSSWNQRQFQIILGSSLCAGGQSQEIILISLN